MPLPKPCKKCEKKYQPTGKFQRYCNECIEILMSKGKKKRWNKG